jgi:hypothetical protein
MKHANRPFRPVLALAAGLLPLVSAVTVLPLGLARPALAAAARQADSAPPSRRPHRA